MSETKIALSKRFTPVREELRRNWALYLTLVLLTLVVIPSTGFCDVEGTMRNIQGKLINTILPLAAILGFIFALWFAWDVWLATLVWHRRAPFDGLGRARE